MADKNSKEPPKSKAVPKAKKKVSAEEKEAIANRLKDELARQPSAEAPPKAPEVVAILEKPDLKRLLAYRDRLLDSKEHVSMLQTAYNALLSDFRMRYELPDDSLIDEETGVVRMVPNG